MNWPRLNTRPAIRRRRSWRPSLEEVEGRQLLNNTPLYVLGTNGILWLESPGWNLPGHSRTWVDANVQAFAFDPQKPGYLYVEGTNHTLWLESPGWQQHGRTWVDGNVQAFAVDPSAPGYLYVEGTDHTLWQEAPGWNLPGHSRTWVDGNVQAFAATPLRPATSTWRGPTTSSGGSPPAGTCRGTRHLGRRQRPGLRPRPLCVRLPVRGGDQPHPLAGVPRLELAGALAHLGRRQRPGLRRRPPEPGYLYVEGTDHTLWLESPGWNLPGHSRTWVDGNVQAFAADPSASGYLYVEGTNHILWLESPGWQQYGRTWVDGNVQVFAGAEVSDSTYLALTSEGPSGGNGGSPFDDGEVGNYIRSINPLPGPELAGSVQIASVTVFSGVYIDSIQVTYAPSEGVTGQPGKHGGGWRGS